MEVEVKRMDDVEAEENVHGIRQNSNESEKLMVVRVREASRVSCD